MATHFSGSVIPCADSGRSVGFDPNQGVSLEPHALISGFPATSAILVAKGIAMSLVASSGLGNGLDRRTKNPYSGARIGPFSRSAARNEKFPALVQTVTIVRATSSAWVVYCCCLRHLDLPM